MKIKKIQYLTEALIKLSTFPPSNFMISSAWLLERPYASYNTGYMILPTLILYKKLMLENLDGINTYSL